MNKARKNTGNKHKAKSSTPTEPVGSYIHPHKEEYPVDQGTMEPPGLKVLPAPRGVLLWNRKICFNTQQIQMLTSSL